jgi:hypothetical protein
MQKVETSVGENDAPPVAFPRAKLQNEFVKCQDCGMQRVSMLACDGANANPSEIQFYHAACEGRWGSELSE